MSLNEKALEELTRNNASTTELQELNTQFNFLLCKLFKFVDETVRENVALKEKRHDDEVRTAPNSDNQTVKVSDVSKNQEQPEQTSGESEEDDEVSDLPPLDFPVFDLDKWIKIILQIKLFIPFYKST